MTPSMYLAFVATETVLCLTPGPAVMLIVSHGLTGAGRGSAWGTLGILVANAIYFATSAFGLGALLFASATLFTVVRWCGVAYLAFLGLSMLLRPSASLAENGRSKVCGNRCFFQGLLLQLSNPKAIIFFVALLPQFIATDTSVAPQFLLLGVTSIVIEAIILLGYGAAASSAGRFIRNDRLLTIQRRLSGGCLLGAAVGVAVAGEFRR